MLQQLYKYQGTLVSNTVDSIINYLELCLQCSYYASLRHLMMGGLPYTSSLYSEYRNILLLFTQLLDEVFYYYYYVILWERGGLSGLCA
jgi:hypothetical protein